MRVGLGITALTANRRAGRWDGITTYSDSLMASLRAAFHQHEFAGVAFALGYEWLANPLRKFEIGAVLNMMSGCKYDASRIFGRSFDVFHALDHNIPALKTPVVATVHDACPLSMPHLVPGRLRYWKNRLYRAKCRVADRVIAVSNYAAAEISQYVGIPRRDIDVVYEGVADHIIMEAAVDLDWAGIEATYGLRPGYILYCGAFSKRKNLFRLVDAYLALPAALRREHPLVLVGGGTAAEAGRELQETVRQPTAARDIICLGRLADDQMAKVLHHAEVFAFPSLHEGFGLPVIEALHLGIPVLTSNVTALPEVTDGCAVLINPGSRAEISAGLDLLLSSASLRQELAERGRVRGSTFSWERCSRETFSIYERVLESA